MIRPVFLGFAALSLPLHAQVQKLASPVEFNRDVRPILSDNCFTCHGQDAAARKGGLRLDDRAIALTGGKSGLPAIVPGKPDESELLLRITAAHDSEDLMPTVESKKTPLTPPQVATLRQWIAEGAEYQSHWAFIPPTRPAVPAGANGKNPIDAFVSARRTAAGSKGAPEAAPEMLARRLWLDLVGLPPSPQELDEFLAAYAKDREKAYGALVEKLLASPRYGEKWARHWLDAARYADSDGYEKDLPRQQWAWRDWVIKSLNADQPYDQFIVDQIAGDLLAPAERDPQRAQDLRVATGYLRNSMISEEGAIIPEQYRMEGMFDRMDAIGKGVVGVTLQCAQCHTHKFDPITHEDYFRVFAAINNTYDATTRIYGPEKLATIDRLHRELAAEEAKLKAAQPGWAKFFAAWSEAQAAAVAATPWETLTPVEPVWGGGLAHPDVLPDGSVITLGFRASDGDLSFTTTPKLAAGATALRLEALNHGDLIFGGPGRSIDGLFAVSELEVEVLPSGYVKPVNEKTAEVGMRKLGLARASADFESPAHTIDKPFRKGDDDKRTVGPSAYLVDGKLETGWSPDRGVGRRNAPSEVVVQFKEPLTLAAGEKLRVTLRFKHSGKDNHGRDTQLLGRFRVALTAAPDATASKIPTAARLALAVPAAVRTPEQQAALFAAWRTSVASYADTNAAIETLWAQYPTEDSTVLTLGERIADDTRGTFMLERGAWDKPKTRVTPGTPAFLHALRAELAQEPDRLAFAHWLVDRRSPTAARVAVNRVWQVLFGAGLVETSEDFGVRAGAPAQPEVFDWLAVEFMDRGWSQKKLIRTIVTSATYRQSSVITPELQERDPKNRLLARGPRFRADAEVVRDIALRTSGLLTEKVGGPSIFPPVPESLFASSFIAVDFWKTATDAERYRRSLYVFRRRSMPDPVLASFDAPNGDSACAARPRSNTPLAALASLNEIVFVEASQALALRILREGGATGASRAAYGFRLCTARAARPDEIAELVAVMKTPRARVAEGWISARELAFGDAAKLPELPAGITPVDVAAWTIAARVLLNLDETLTKS
ncbi:MAG: PSD1 domain-containing protein [Undibacterium sp.]|nr:PSD1 domain-containing protein [Opitutaceae bacterium]